MSFYGLYIALKEGDEAFEDALLLDSFIQMQFRRVAGSIQYQSRLVKLDGSAVRMNYFGDLGEEARKRQIQEGISHKDDQLSRAEGCTLFIWKTPHRLKGGDYLSMCQRITEYLAGH